MRPWQHARSSALGTSRSWTNDLTIHEFMDATKFACADRRHRVVLHHIDLGAEVLSRVFPERDDIAQLVNSHVIEDLGRTATLLDWFEHCDLDQLPAPIHRRMENGSDGIAEMVGNRHPEIPRKEINHVSDFLFQPTRFLSSQGDRALSVFMNSVGPLLIRSVFGPPRAVDGGKGIVDYAWLAEAVIYTVFGRIPDLGEVVRCFTAEPSRERDR